MDNNEKRERLNEAMNAIRAILSEVGQEIVKELKLRDEFKADSGKQKFKFCNKGNNKVSLGVRPGKNDYRNYIWIEVEDITDDSKKWMIALDYQDIDGGNELQKNTGNLHTQFGRIQFWSGVNKTKGTCDSPHELISKEGEDIIVKFCGSKSFDSKQAIYDGTYDPKALVDSFLYEFANCGK